MSENVKLKIYPSSSGFVTRMGVISEYNSGCPRFIVISKGTKRKELNPIYSELGLVHENWHANAIKDLIESRELPITFEIVEGVWYSGRCDFKLKDGSIDETKASISKSFLYSVIRKGKYKISHLAQLVSYLIHFKQTKGRIVAGFYTTKKSDLGNNIFILKESRIFNVEILESGQITVDKEDSGYTVIDQYKHALLSAEILKSEEIKDRPINHIEFTGPCFMCPLKIQCSNYDKGDITSDQLKIIGKGILNGS